MTAKRQCPKCQSQNVYYRHTSQSWVCRKHGPILRERSEREGSETSADPLAPSGEEENKAARVRVEEKPTPGDTNIHADVAAAIRALAAEEIGGSAGLGRIGAALQSSTGIWDERVVKVQVFDFGRPQAEEIFAFFSSSGHPPAFVYNEQEKCLETELELICDDETGKYWCGGDRYYLADAKQQIDLREGKVTITTPQGVRYQDLIARRVIKIQIFNLGRTQAEKIFGLCSSSRHPPAFVQNEQEKCLETELPLIYDKSSGKYWCGWDIYYLEDAQKEIWLGMGEVKIITPEGVGYRDLIVRDGRSRLPRW